MFPVVIFLAAQAFDFFSFLAMIGRHGLAAEINPFVHRLATEYGLLGVTTGKIAATIVAVSTAAILARTRPRLALTVVSFGIAAGLLGGFSNLASM